MIPTTLVGSYPQPDWLVDKIRYRETVVPRIRMPELWRVPASHLEEAQDDAVRLAVEELGYPVFVKPNSLGSSVGIGNRPQSYFPNDTLWRQPWLLSECRLRLSLNFEANLWQRPLLRSPTSSLWIGS